MSLNPNVILVQPGAYLFHGKSVVQAEVGKNLLVLFSAPRENLCAIVVSDGNGSNKILEDMLDNGFQTLVEKLKEDSPIQCKVFGAGYGNLQPLDTAVAWIENHGLSILAKDVGRSVNRKITVLCQDGRAGVQYGGAPQESLAELIPRGTARARSGAPNQHEALILTSSPVSGQLLRQAVEEHASWRATVPSKPLLWLKRNIHRGFRWHLVLFVEGWCEESSARWAGLIREVRPDSQCLWSGETPLPDSSVVHLPPFTPENQRHFKEALAQAMTPSQARTQQSKKS